jgi:hypothetical protein
MMHFSSPAVIVVSGGAAGGGTPTSPPLTGLAVWLDADNSGDVLNSTGPDTQATNGQTVEQWNDRSGNGNNFTSTSTYQPVFTTNVLNSKSAVQFVSDDNMNGNSSSLDIFKNVGYAGIFMVLKHTGGDTTREAFSVAYNSGGSTRVSIYKNSPYTYYSMGGRRVNSGSFDGDALTTADSDAAVILGCILDFANAEKYGRLNGSEEMSDSSFQTAGNTADTSAYGFSLGKTGGSSSTANNFEGDFHEILCYNQSLSAGDISDVESYLSNKWGISI